MAKFENIVTHVLSLLPSTPHLADLLGLSSALTPISCKARAGAYVRDGVISSRPCAGGESVE